MVAPYKWLWLAVQWRRFGGGFGVGGAKQAGGWGGVADLAWPWSIMLACMLPELVRGGILGSAAADGGGPGSGAKPTGGGGPERTRDVR